MTERRAHISKWIWARVMAAYGFACAACREPFSDGARVDIDHMADMHPEIAVLKIPKTKKPKKVSHA